LVLDLVSNSETVGLCYVCQITEIWEVALNFKKEIMEKSLQLSVS
jgi:hypothetical protein